MYDWLGFWFVWIWETGFSLRRRGVKDWRVAKWESCTKDRTTCFGPVDSPATVNILVSLSGIPNSSELQSFFDGNSAFCWFLGVVTLRIHLLSSGTFPWFLSPFTSPCVISSMEKVITIYNRQKFYESSHPYLHDHSYLFVFLCDGLIFRNLLHQNIIYNLIYYFRVIYTL